MNHKIPSNFIGDYDNEQDLDKYDFNCDEARGCFFHLLETESFDLPKVTGETLADCIKNARNWKTGDLKNGWQSITISEFPIQEADLKRRMTIDWNGLVLYKGKYRIPLAQITI